MAQLAALGLEIAHVVTVRKSLQRDAFGHLESVPLDPEPFRRVVGHDSDRGQAQVRQDLGTDPVVARVHGQAQRQVRFHRVMALVLEGVGPELVGQSDAPSLLAHVQEHATAFVADALERLLKLVTAIASHGTENIPRETLGVHADEHVRLTVHVALDQGDVVVAGQLVLVQVGLEFPVPAGDGRGDHTLDEFLAAPAVLDQVLDRDDLQVVLVRDLDQPGQAGHGPVVVHDLAEHAGGIETGQLHHVDRGLGVSGPAQDAAVEGLQREDVARARQIVGPAFRTDEHLDRLGAVRRGNARRGTIHGIDGYGEARAVQRRIDLFADHGGHLQFFQAFARGRKADQSTAVPGHEIDGRRCRSFGGHDEIAFVFAVFVVDDNQYAPGLDLLDRFRDGTIGVRHAQ